MHGQSTGRAPNCVCKTCGVEFYTKPSQIRLRNGGQHCSRACKYANPDVFHRGTAHHGWRGDEIAMQSGHQRARRLYDLDVCERCGEPAVDRHHVDGDTTNNALANVERLCRRCHMETDGRLERLRIAQRRKLTGEQANAIRERYAALARSGRRRPKGSVDALAAEFGVSTSLVRKIGTGRMWQEL